jgi:hypothetical protein
MTIRELLQLLSEADSLDAKVYVESCDIIHECSKGSASSNGVFIILEEETETQFS